MSELSSARPVQPWQNSTSPLRAATANRKWGVFASTMQQSGLIVVVAFCAAGLLLTFAALAWLPDFLLDGVSQVP